MKITVHFSSMEFCAHNRKEKNSRIVVISRSTVRELIMQFQPTKSVGRLQMVFSWMHWKNILEYSSGFHGNHSINQQNNLYFNCFMQILWQCNCQGSFNDQRSNELRETVVWQLNVAAKCVICYAAICKVFTELSHACKINPR